MPTYIPLSQSRSPSLRFRTSEGVQALRVTSRRAASSGATLHRPDLRPGSSHENERGEESRCRAARVLHSRGSASAVRFYSCIAARTTVESPSRAKVLSRHPRRSVRFKHWKRATSRGREGVRASSGRGSIRSRRYQDRSVGIPRKWQGHETRDSPSGDCDSIHARCDESGNRLTDSQWCLRAERGHRREDRHRRPSAALGT